MSYLETLNERAAKLRVQLNDLVKADKPEPRYDAAAGLPDWEFERAKLLTSLEVDLMVTHVEVNDLHGTGILIKRMFPDWRRIMHVWTCKAYPVNDFGIVQMFISGWKASRYRMYSTGLEGLRPYQIRRVMCVPFSVEDVYLAMAAADTRGVPLMIYIMDDQNLTNHRIPDSVMREALEKADVVFVISPEMRDAYETKFGIKTFVLPPVVRAGDLRAEPVAEAGVEFKNTGVLLGNIWNKTWLDEIRHVIRDSGKKIHWYGNAGKFVDFDEADLERDGIVYKGALPEREICSEIRKYAFGVLPSSPDDQEDWLAKYSIPTRLVTSVAAGNLPMIVIGSEQSASSQFVKRFGVGSICPYDSAAFAAAVDAINLPERQLEVRKIAADCAGLFSDAGLDEWLWASLAKGSPEDDRFEAAFAPTSGDTSVWMEQAAPSDIYHGLHESYFPYRRLARLGYQPDFFLDVGASNGVFSDLISRVFPQTRQILVEPLADIYREKSSYFFDKHPEFELLQVAMSDEPGEATFHVSEDLFNSSLIAESLPEAGRPVTVPIKTLDGIAGELAIEGRGLIKVDVQCAEHKVLAGGAKFLEQVDGVLLELTLKRLAPEAKVFSEMLELLDSLGFRYFDECGGWRSPRDGRLEQKDVLFLRKGLLEPKE